MLKLNYTTSDFTRESIGYQLFLPINVTMLIPEHDSVGLLSQIVEELDLKDLMMAYSSNGRNPAVPPRIMLKILIYAYMSGIYSSRAIERSCRRDINFMWLLNGHQAPDHNTISRFRTGRVKHCLESLLNQFVMRLHREGEIPFENIFIDGTKIEANAGKYTFVWKGAIEKFDARLPDKARGLIKRMNDVYDTEFHLEEDGDLVSVLRGVAEFLMEKKEMTGTVFVRGKGKRKSELQRITEETISLLEKKENYLDCMGKFGERNSFSKTDHDATFMRMKDDYMRNGQLKPGYNFQIGVENGYAVGIDVSSERNDMYTLIPMLEKIEKNFPKKRFSNIVCDAGYESEENYDFLNCHEYSSYIKPANYEKLKNRNYKKWVGRRENMSYDAVLDEYVCANGRRLKAVRTKINRKRRSKYPVELTVYECENCEGCEFKANCKKTDRNKRIEVSKRFACFRDASQTNITSDKGIVLRLNRSIQAEGAFAMLKENYRFRRFLTRGESNVFTECLLMVFSFNINKLHNRILGRGNRQILYEPRAA